MVNELCDKQIKTKHSSFKVNDLFEKHQAKSSSCIYFVINNNWNVFSLTIERSDKQATTSGW